MVLGVIAACAISSPVVTPLSGEAWKFSRPGGAWSQVRVPHDWAQRGVFRIAVAGFRQISAEAVVLGTVSPRPGKM